ncbi:MAG: amidohydrolase family protein [Actinomycetes bacterium]
MCDLGVAGDRITAVADPGTLDEARVLDAAGRLVTPPLVNAHLHLDKVYTLPMAGDAALTAYTAGDMGGAMTGIELAVRSRGGTTGHGSPRTRAGRSASASGTGRCTSSRSSTSTPPRASKGCTVCWTPGRSSPAWSTCRWWRSPKKGSCATRAPTSSARGLSSSAPTSSGASRGSSTPTPMPAGTSTGPARWRHAWGAASPCWSTTRATPRGGRPRCSPSRCSSTG